MLIYFLCLFVVSFAALMAQRRGNTLGTIRFFYFIAISSMVLVAGLRDKSVGTDTGNYVLFFSETDTFMEVIKYGGQTYEYGYHLLNWFIHFFSDQYMALFLAFASIVVGCYFTAIITHSTNIAISFFVFITMGFYTFFFNGARQGVACAICAVALDPLFKREFKKYLGFILLAALFHKTALVMLPVYFLLDNNNSIKINVLYGIVGIIGALSLQKVVEFGAQIDPRYQHYAIVGEGGGHMMVAFTCLLVVFFMMFKKHIVIERERYALFLNMLIFGAMISLISSIFKINPSGILRFSLYFNISTIFLWPIVYENIRNRSARILFSYIFVVGYIVFFTLTTQRFSNLVPYGLNPYISFF